jgi:hypothetical protein
MHSLRESRSNHVVPSMRSFTHSSHNMMFGCIRPPRFINLDTIVFRGCDNTTTFVPNFSPTPSPTSSPIGPTPAPTGAPSQLNYNNFVGTTFCDSDGITLDGVDDYLSVTPTFALTAESTVAIRLKFLSLSSKVNIFDFGSGCLAGYYVLAESNLKLTQAITDCGSYTPASFWWVLLLPFPFVARVLIPHFTPRCISFLYFTSRGHLEG